MNKPNICQWIYFQFFEIDYKSVIINKYAVLEQFMRHCHLNSVKIKSHTEKSQTCIHFFYKDKKYLLFYRSTVMLQLIQS